MPEGVDQFRKLVDLAQTGELQSAVSKVGGFNVNPHYYENPSLMRMVGFFMNVVVPTMQEFDQNSEGGISTIRLANIGSSDYGITASTAAPALGLADKAGFVYKADVVPNGDTPQTSLGYYRPAKNIMNLEPADLMRGKYVTPELKGCSLGFVALFASTATGVAMKNPLLGVAVGGLSTAGGMKLGYKHGKFKAGRQAYKYYRQAS